MSSRVGVETVYPKGMNGIQYHAVRGIDLDLILESDNGLVLFNLELLSDYRFQE